MPDTAAVRLFWPTPCVWTRTPSPALAVISSRFAQRSDELPDIVSVIVSAVVSSVVTTVYHVEIVEPSVALADDCEYSLTFVQALSSVSPTDWWSVVAPSVALIDCV